LGFTLLRSASLEKKYRSRFQRLAVFFGAKVLRVLERTDKVPTFAPLREGGCAIRRAGICRPGAKGRGEKNNFFVF